jgi:predicted thioesterase
MKVVAQARIVRLEKRTVFLEVRAHDEKELIGDGTHERVVVNVEKFSERVKRKLGI